MDTPLAVCELRDVKGLYRKARAGLIKGEEVKMCIHGGGVALITGFMKEVENKRLVNKLILKVLQF